MRRSIRTRLTLFAVLSLVMVAFTGARYAQLTDRVLDTTYLVSAELEVSGGIFENAEVTYRGVPVGRVESVELTDTGVVARLDIRNEWKIPDDAQAHVRNRSAVGEQYVDLVPQRTGSPYLKDGSRLDTSRTSTPLPEEELVRTIDTFVRSVNLRDLRVVVSELGTGFRGSAQDLQALLDGTHAFVAEAEAHLPETIELLRHTRTVLGTQQQNASNLRSFAHSLALVTGTLRKQDPAIRGVIRHGAPTARELTGLVNGLALTVPELLGNMAVLGRATLPQLPGLAHALAILPYDVAAIQAIIRDRRSYLGLALNPTPNVCQKGYIPPDKWRSTNDLSVVPPPNGVHCAEPGKVWRGSEHAP